MSAAGGIPPRQHLADTKDVGGRQLVARVMAVSEVTYLEARPSIEVGDLDAALAFWRDVAGFDVEVVMGEPPEFAMVRSGGAGLGLARTDAPAIPRGSRRSSSPWRTSMASSSG